LYDIPAAGNRIWKEWHMNFKATTQNLAREPILNCPSCNHEIRLTESLAAPLIEETRRHFQEQLAAKDAQVAHSLDTVRKDREELGRAREQLEEQVAQRLAAERSRIIAGESKKAREAVSADLQAKEAEAADLRRMLELNNGKLAEAQQAQADVLRKQRDFDEARRELELTVEKRVQASVDQVRTKAKQEADETARLSVVERDQTIESMARTIEELKRKAERGSEKGRGEALEIELEEVLSNRFPLDVIEPVAKGEFGADLMQRVNGGVALSAGTILWELKRTKSFSDAWLSKIRDDQRRCGADIALIVSQALPKDTEHFDLLDGVWIAHPRCAIPLAIALRQTLIEVHGTRLVQQDQTTKMEQVYRYLTGTRFRQRVEAVIEKFDDMRDELARERKFMSRQWATRETQIVTVIESTVGMVGDLQAIVGKAMAQISRLDAPLLESGK
jgi:hypothetical protein